MKKILLKIFIGIVILLTLTAIGIWYVQEDCFFYPWHDEESYVYLQETENFEEIKIDNNGKLIDGWFKYNNDKNEKKPLVIMFGGNAQNSSNTCRNFEENSKFEYLNEYNFFIIDYPKYGKSEGKISDVKMFESALIAYDYACGLDCVDNEKIVVIGYSIGTGVATYVASQRDVNGLILLAPYDNALSLYNANVNIFYGPIKLLTKYKFKSDLYAQSVNVSPLIFTSYQDEVINYNFTINLSKKFKELDNLIILKDIGHNDYFEQENVWNEISRYLTERN